MHQRVNIPLFSAIFNLLRALKPGSQAAGQPGSQAAGQPGSRAAGSSMAAGLNLGCESWLLPFSIHNTSLYCKKSRQYSKQCSVSNFFSISLTPCMMTAGISLLKATISRLVSNCLSVLRTIFSWFLPRLLLLLGLNLSSGLDQSKTSARSSRLSQNSGNAPVWADNVELALADAIDLRRTFHQLYSLL